METQIGISNGSPGQLVSFYLGKSTDDRGRTITEIQSRDNSWLERTHDYIQWLFPLKEPSGANPDAPTLNSAQIEMFNTDPKLRSALTASVKTMLRFYGLECEDSAQIVVVRPAQDFADRERTWLRPGNHNYLRITRILTSSRILGLERYTLALFAFLDELYRRDASKIGVSYEFWKSAAHDRKPP